MPLVAILDDRLTNRNIHARLAGSLEADTEVVTFGDPRAALAWLARHDADLVVTEYKMPHLDGAEFTRSLRACPSCLDIPVVVITAHDDRSFRLQALAAGATDFLRSPIDQAEFIGRCRNLLRMRRQQRIIQARTRELECRLQDSELSRARLMRDSRDALAQVIDTVPALISAADRDGTVVFVNAPQAALDAVPGHEPDGGVLRFDDDYRRRSHSLDLLVFRSRRALPAFEQGVTDGHGRRRILLTTKSPLRDGDGAITSVLTTSLDITDRKRTERHLQHVASHDGLTDLPNRLLLRERLGDRLSRINRGTRLLALHVLDLDRFKAVNDQMGYRRGDALLREIAARLLAGADGGANWGANGSVTVARIGGDKFALLQDGIEHPDHATRLAAAVIERIGQPLAYDGQEVSIGCSVGTTLAPRDGIDPEELLRNADLALHQAKRDGRNRHRLFADDMNRRGSRNLQLRQQLRQALNRGELALHYQPQMNLRTGRIAGVEALIRWNHPTEGLLGPAAFLPAAEDLIADIDAWALRRACTDARQWQRPGLPPVQVGVNLSPRHVGTERTRQTIAAVLAETGLDPSLLELEITEHDLLDDVAAAAAVLGELRRGGVRVAIDDFGIGFSFLSHVKNLPVDRLKIDQCFVRNLQNDPNDAVIVRAIIGLAHDLQMTVVAEGVETVEQLSHLAGENCDEIQGYYVSRPLPLPELVEMLRRDGGS